MAHRYRHCMAVYGSSLGIVVLPAVVLSYQPILGSCLRLLSLWSLLGRPVIPLNTHLHGTCWKTAHSFRAMCNVLPFILAVFFPQVAESSVTIPHVKHVIDACTTNQVSSGQQHLSMACHLNSQTGRMRPLVDRTADCFIKVNTFVQKSCLMHDSCNKYDHPVPFLK